MTNTSQSLTLQEYLNFDDHTETRYELVSGKLITMPPESDRNQRIVSLLFAYFLQLGMPSYRVRIGAEIVVSGTRATVRLPDLMVLSPELKIALQGAIRSTVTIDMPPPQLVVEIVSPGKSNEDRDYPYKRSEYAARGINEYWIVDPLQEKVTVLTWAAGLYEEQVFRADKQVGSQGFSNLNLSVKELLG